MLSVKVVPPLFGVWFQGQKRMQGDFHQSSQKFVIPGGMRSDNTGWTNHNNVQYSKSFQENVQGQNLKTLTFY